MAAIPLEITLRTLNNIHYLGKASYFLDIKFNTELVYTVNYWLFVGGLSDLWIIGGVHD